MEKEQHRAAKGRMIALMQAGHSWQEAASLADIQISRSAAYRLIQKVRTQGETGLQDGRHGHPAKLIPIVTTADTVDAVELAQTYIRRWPVQENIIRDWLLPLFLDTNHGYAKTPIVNSEVSKKRAALEKRLSNVKRWAASARDRSHRASVLYDRLWKRALGLWR
jgi:hypothetical protein